MFFLSKHRSCSTTFCDENISPRSSEERFIHLLLPGTMNLSSELLNLEGSNNTFAYYNQGEATTPGDDLREDLDLVEALQNSFVERDTVIPSVSVEPVVPPTAPLTTGGIVVNRLSDDNCLPNFAACKTGGAREEGREDPRVRTNGVVVNGVEPVAARSANDLSGPEPRRSERSLADRAAAVSRPTYATWENTGARDLVRKVAAGQLLCGSALRAGSPAVVVPVPPAGGRPQQVGVSATVVPPSQQVKVVQKSVPGTEFVRGGAAFASSTDLNEVAPPTVVRVPYLVVTPGREQHDQRGSGVGSPPSHVDTGITKDDEVHQEPAGTTGAAMFSRYNGGRAIMQAPRSAAPPPATPSPPQSPQGAPVSQQVQSRTALTDPEQHEQFLKMAKRLNVESAPGFRGRGAIRDPDQHRQLAMMAARMASLNIAGAAQPHARGAIKDEARERQVVAAARAASLFDRIVPPITASTRGIQAASSMGNHDAVAFSPTSPPDKIVPQLGERSYREDSGAGRGRGRSAPAPEEAIAPTEEEADRSQLGVEAGAAPLRTIEVVLAGVVPAVGEGPASEQESSETAAPETAAAAAPTKPAAGDADPRQLPAAVAAAPRQLPTTETPDHPFNSARSSQQEPVSSGRESLGSYPSQAPEERPHLTSFGDTLDFQKARQTMEKERLELETALLVAESAVEAERAQAERAEAERAEAEREQAALDLSRRSMDLELLEQIVRYGVVKRSWRIII